MTLQRAVFFGQRNHRVFAGDRFGHQFDDRRRNRHVAQVVVLKPIAGGHRLHDLFAGGVAQLHQRLLRLDSLRYGQLLSFGPLLVADKALFYQVFAEIHEDCLG